MKSKHRMEQVLCCAILILLALIVLVLALWVISTTFKTEAQTYSPKPQWIPDPISLESFRRFFTTYNFGRMTLSGLVTCILATIIYITCACLAGYGITRFQFKSKKQLMDFLLVTQIFPSVILVVPFYAVLSEYHTTSKLIRFIIVYTVANVALSTWVLVSYSKTIPIELNETTRVDGASSFRIFWSIILPLIVPGIAAAAISVLFSGWNEHMYPSVLISSDQLKTLTVDIISLNSQYQIKWNDLMAASAVSSLSLVVLFTCFQKYLIAGMTGGAVKS